jgi:hypothetical protein
MCCEVFLSMSNLCLGLHNKLMMVIVLNPLQFLSMIWQCDCFSSILSYGKNLQCNCLIWFALFGKPHIAIKEIGHPRGTHTRVEIHGLLFNFLLSKNFITKSCMHLVEDLTFLIKEPFIWNTTCRWTWPDVWTWTWTSQNELRKITLK